HLARGPGGLLQMRQRVGESPTRHFHLTESRESADVVRILIQGEAELVLRFVQLSLLQEIVPGRDVIRRTPRGTRRRAGRGHSVARDRLRSPVCTSCRGNEKREA